ncbi:hypothetical protein LZ318_20575 [Saccharopolyspora indica]|uniref:HIT family protein n=1 Tax=Saccharopolyspora indica TaxID=1229659 RepID=UPI0022EAB496|nr:hypothetical protein [Saccharopolyspora indica]MDA3643218.1 hypothetical protein [Saccharopolyspora indica]
MTDQEGQSGCLACDLSSGATHLPGGRVHATRFWVVEHCIGPLGVGALVVKPLRHVLHIAELTAEESAELGPLLRRVTAAIEEVLRPEQVYACLWSHSGGVPGHIHFVLQPATRELMDQYGAYGPALQTAMFAESDMPDEAAVSAICTRYRAVLDA